MNTEKPIEVEMPSKEKKLEKENEMLKQELQKANTKEKKLEKENEMLKQELQKANTAIEQLKTCIVNLTLEKQNALINHSRHTQQ